MTSSIVLSKPLEGKEDFILNYAHEILKEGKELVFVLTDRDVEEMKLQLEKNKINFKDIYFIDGYSMQNLGKVNQSKNIKNVSGPMALNEMSIAISNFGRDFLKEHKTFSIIFDSLSTLLIYSNGDAIARFLQVLIGKIKNFNGEILFTLEAGMHDQKTLVTIEHLMDNITEVKIESGKVYAKSYGKDESWKELKK